MLLVDVGTIVVMRSIVIIIITPISSAPTVLPALEPPVGCDDQQQQQFYRYYNEQQQRDLKLAEDMLDLIRGMAGQDADNQVRHFDVGCFLCCDILREIRDLARHTRVA